MTRNKPSRIGLLLSLAALLWSAACGDDGVAGSGDTQISDVQVSLPDAGDSGDVGVDSEADTGGSAPVLPLALSFEEVTLDVQDDAATDLVFLPDGDGFLVLQKNGRVNHYRFDDGADSGLPTSATRAGSFQVPAVDATADCGLLSAAFDPDWGGGNWHLYLGHCSSVTHSRITRHDFAPPDYDAAVASTAEVIEVGDDEAPEPWHNVGSLRFGEDGWLWALFGDKAMGDPAQDPANALGTLVRLDTDSFEPAAGGLEADVYAWGLRSPWKGVFDAAGRFWLGDVGAADVEEINVVTARDQNFAWPVWEGPCDSDCEGFTQPVTWWDRSAAHPYAVEDQDTAPTDRRVAWVGLEHDPTTAAGDPYQGRWAGRMLVGDFCAGWIRSLELDAEGALATDTLAGHLEGVTGVAQAPDGHVYLATYGNCFTFPLQPTRLFRAVLND